MLKFNKTRLTENLLDQWVAANVNVLLVGEKGVGKTYQILDCFKRNNLKFSYFSGATLDPWIHLLGIPKAVERDGKEKMEFILPENLDDDVEAIFCDEWNRTNKVVRNALLELQQFKSINGRKFPNLKLVWGAVNPPSSDESEINYDVDELDPAQLDRFHIIVELPNEPDKNYFKNKFGDYRGDVLVEWWKEQPEEAFKILSPRRLDYIGECFLKGLDVKYLLPVSANHIELIKKLSSDPDVEEFKEYLRDNKKLKIEKFLSDEVKFLKVKNLIKNEKCWELWKYVKPEFVDDEIKNNKSFADYAIYKIFQKDEFFKNRILEINKATPNAEVCKIIKMLKSINYSPTKTTTTLDNYLGNQPNFKILDGITEGNSIDTFTKNIVGANNVHTLSVFFNNAKKTIDNTTIKDDTVLATLLMVLSSCIYNTGIIGPSFVLYLLHMKPSNFFSSIKTSIPFIDLLATSVFLIKSKGTEHDVEYAINIIEKSSHKIAKNRIDEYLNYLRTAKTPIEILPKEFTLKVNSMRKLLEKQ